jgi:hypothetical protein
MTCLSGSTRQTADRAEPERDGLFEAQSTEEGQSPMKQILLAAALAAGYGLCAVPAAAQVSGGIYVQFGPPAPVYQPVPPPPGPYYVWVPGYYRWDDSRYVWVSGRYERPPYAGAYWVPGYWGHHGRGRGRGEWYWVPGHWAEGHGHGDGDDGD